MVSNLTLELKNIIKKHGKLCHYLHQQIHITYQNAHKGTKEREAWHLACKNFQQQYDNLAFPGGENTLYQRLAEGDFYTMEAAICFLEVRPYFFRSGYIYQKLMRKLKYVSLTQEQKARYEDVKQRYQLWKKNRSI